jgi:hypothetical protein
MYLDLDVSSISGWHPRTISPGHCRLSSWRLSSVPSWRTISLAEGGQIAFGSFPKAAASPPRSNCRV